MANFDFRSRGLPIGSGPVEAACKTIVKAHLYSSGMPWNLPGGQHVLNLRVMRKSNRWETAWKYYINYKMINVNRPWGKLHPIIQVIIFT